MRAGGDRLTHALLAVVAVAVVWIALRPGPPPALAAGPGGAVSANGAVSVTIERVGGRTLVEGVLPVKCVR